MGTSTGDITHETERPESVPGEVNVTLDTNQGGETTTNALQNGKFSFFFIFTKRILML